MDKAFNTLIVEDNQNDLKQLLLILQRASININYICVEDERGYIDALEKRQWDIILTDYALPKFNCIKAMEILDQRASDIPVIIVSSSSDKEKLPEYMKSGPRDFILKNNISRLPELVKREVEYIRLKRAHASVVKQLEIKENLLKAMATNFPLKMSIKDTEGALILGNTQNSNTAHSPEGKDSTKDRPLKTARMYREQITHKDGNIHTYLTTKFPLLGPHKTPIAIGHISTDITEQLEIEKHNLTLERQLNSAQKMEALGLLTGGIAHDFNNILTIIIGYNTLAKLKLQTQYSDEELTNYLEQIDIASARAKELISQMQIFSKSESIELAEVSIMETISQTLQLLKSTLPSSIEINVDYKNGSQKTWGNIVQIQQIFINLIINAKDAMNNNGKIDIIVEHHKAYNESYCDSCHQPIIGHFIEASVIDSGTGIEESNLKRIFTPFFTTKDVGKGTGMGLSVVHGIMHKMGGHIQVTSNKEGGTKFHLFFPPHEINAGAHNYKQTKIETTAEV